MTKTNNTKLLGYCQCCGRLQAVKSNRMAHHGYQVKDGWFQGVCPGHQFAPMQRERFEADYIVATVRQQVAELRQYAADLASGSVTLGIIDDPRHASHKRGQDKVTVAWSDLPAYYADQARDHAIWQTNARADSGERFAAFMTDLVTKVHGTCLIEAERPCPPVVIQSGERRVLANGCIATSTAFAWRGRVAFTYDRNGQQFHLGMGTRTWRLLEKVDG